jgi:hypothetical protein
MSVRGHPRAIADVGIKGVPEEVQGMGGVI